MIKSYKLKIDECYFDVEHVINEQHEYYNRFSLWINEHLTDTVGDLLLPYFDEEKKTNKYYKNIVSKKDLKLYSLITNTSTHDLVNAIYYSVVKKLDIDKYKGNELGISATDYRLNGYISSVIENYKSSLKKLRPNIKSRTVTSDSDEETKCQQCVYELSRHTDFFDEKGWDGYLKYLNGKSAKNENIINRMNILFEYFKENKELVNEQYNLSCVSRLQSYNGCVRNDGKLAMQINSGSHSIFSLSPIKENFGYAMTLNYGKDASEKHVIKLKGHRNIIDFIDGERVEKTLLVDKPCHSLILTKEPSGCYAIVMCESAFDKTAKPIKNVVGVDVNTKHTLLSTSIIDDGNFKGYVNIYKALLKDKEFFSLIEDNKERVQIYKSISESVTFCPIESEFLYTRKFDKVTKSSKIEKCLSRVLDELQDKYYKDGDIDNRNYISMVKMLRAKLSAYFNVYMAYLSAQSRFDNENQDDSIVFSKTPKGVGFWNKLHAIEADIIGCRDNIICYAFRLFSKNNYDTIALEDLTSSSFEKGKAIPSIDSMLDYPKHGWRGMSIDNVKLTKDYDKFGSKYDIIVDENNTVIDLKFNEEGIVSYYKPLFYNLIIKKVKFASIKDVFAKISNNTEINIVSVPSFFTSLMDSNDHKIFVDEKKKRIGKEKVRAAQEKFINGLNADYNAAKNIEFMAKDDSWRTQLCGDKPKFEYNTPIYEAKIKSQDKMFNTIMKIGAYKVLCNEK